MFAGKINNKKLNSVVTEMFIRGRKLIEKQLKHQLYHQAKLVCMNILQERKCYHLIKNIIIEQS